MDVKTPDGLWVLSQGSMMAKLWAVGEGVEEQDAECCMAGLKNLVMS